MPPIRFSTNGRGGEGARKPSLKSRHIKATLFVSPILDEINKKFSEYEKRLKAFHPVGDVWVCYHSRPLDPYGNDSTEAWSCVGLTFYEGEWRLCHGTCLDPGPWPEDGQPITDAPRRVRVDVASRFPDLYHKLLEQIVKETEEFGERAARALAKLIAGLEED